MTGLARRLLGKKTCLCTAAKRDSFYDDLSTSVIKNDERQSTDQYGFLRTDKPRRLIHQTNMNETDGEADISIIEKLRRASSQSPVNIPMLVVISFNPDAKGLQKKQIEIQRGFPVNAQFILKEWLFIKTADNEEGFVPYLCCRPIFRRQSIKCLNPIDNSYKPYDFELNKSRQKKSSLTNLSTFTPPTHKKLSLSINKKRHDVTSSSCAGDSGVSDCESSSHNHHSLDLLSKQNTLLSNIRTLRSSSNILKKTGLIVQDLPLKKSSKINQMKSQLSISSNSAFTQIVKKSQRLDSSPTNIRSFHHKQEISPSFNSNFHRPYNSYDATVANSSSSLSKYLPDGSSAVSSPYIRRTPFARRSLPHHIEPISKKCFYSKLSSSSSSSDPFRIIKEEQLRYIVLAEPSLPPAIIPLKTTIEKHFSDLSLNQIENDSLSPSTSHLLIPSRPSLSYSSSSSSTTSSSTDDSRTPFIYIQMKNYHRDERIPVIYASSNIHNNNSNIPTTKSSSFIHKVSITV